MDSEIDDCTVCFESYSKKRVKVTCPKCQKDCCKICFQTFIKSNDSEAKCMHCKTRYDYDFVSDNTTKTFMTKNYKSILEDSFLNKEKSLIGETIAELEEQARLDKIRFKYEEPITEKRYKINDITQKIILMERILNYKKQKNSTDQTIEIIYKKKEDLESNLNIIIQELDSLQDEYEQESGKQYKDKHKKQFIKPCPAPDCRGMLSTQYMCGLCSTKVCPTCLEIKSDEEHTCKPENVATAELIKKSTKACPKCGISIHKTEGCNHLFCIECKTAFDYITGEIHEKGNSNPLYWKWKSSQGYSGPIPDACPESNIPEMDNIISIIKNKLNIYFVTNTESSKLMTNKCYKLSNIIEELYYFAIHISGYEMNSFRTNFITDNKDLRISYLKKCISESEWKIQLQRRYKQSIKYKDIYNILHIFFIELTNILFEIKQYWDSNISAKISDEFINEFIEFVNSLMPKFNKIREYCNSQFLTISKRYNSVQYSISDYVIGGTFHFCNIELYKGNIVDKPIETYEKYLNRFEDQS
jgi:hypothetical protein